MSMHSYTANNQLILRQYIQGKADNLGLKPIKESNALWKMIEPYLPNPVGLGKSLGERIATTYGAQASNIAIEFVARNVLGMNNTQRMSRWSVEAIRNYLQGTAQTTAIRAAQLSITPRALPVITFVSGMTGQVALPAAVALVSLIYSRVMHDSEKVKKLAHFSFDQLLAIDPESGCMQDAFGNPLTAGDIQRISLAAAEYDLVDKLMAICKEIDDRQEKAKKEDLNIDLEDLAKTLFSDLLKSYGFQREDKTIIFPNGQLKTAQDQDIIDKALGVLQGTNPDCGKEEIQALIQTLAKKSLLPLETLTSEDEKVTDLKVAPKRVPPIFPKEGEEAWKNFIVRAEDGSYFLSQDCGDKKRGPVDEATIKSIFPKIQEVELVRKEKEIARKEKAQETLEALMKQPRQHAQLVSRLCLFSKSQDIQAFLEKYLLKREDGKVFYLNGKLLMDQEDLKQIESKFSKLGELEKLIKKWVEQLGQQLPEDNGQIGSILCADGQYASRLDGKIISQEEAEELEKRLKEEASQLAVEFFEKNAVWVAEEKEEAIVYKHIESPLTEAIKSENFYGKLVEAPASSVATTTANTAVSEDLLSTIDFEKKIAEAPRVPSRQPEKTAEKADRKREKEKAT